MGVFYVSRAAHCKRQLKHFHILLASDEHNPTNKELFSILPPQIGP